eukprot:4273053-Pyramimonas_sp.AAC.1
MPEQSQRGKGSAIGNEFGGASPIWMRRAARAAHRGRARRSRVRSMGEGAGSEPAGSRWPWCGRSAPLSRPQQQSP